LKRSAPLLLAGWLVAVGGCGAGATTTPTGSAGGATDSCKPSGTEVRVTVMDATFDKACLAAPADTAFTVRFDNEDSNTHNFDIQKGGVSVFTSDMVIGPKVATYRVQALAAGTYTFRCDIHPVQMHGTFVVSA
jgi:plastocyanin